MRRAQKAFVEVSTIREKGIIAFDFGDFAILEEYDQKNKWDNLVVYWKDQYDLFMKDICGLVDQNSSETVEIEVWDFKEIKRISSKWRPLKAHPCELAYFWDLMDRNFPKHRRKIY